MESAKKWIGVIVFLLFLSFISYILAGLFALVMGQDVQHGNIAVIPIYGAIFFGSDSAYFPEHNADAKDVVDAIKKADKNQDIKALLLDINSPGGTAVASMEIGIAVKLANKTVYAFIREQGTSGAYWVASAADTIIANELSMTGSIGVISSYLEFSGLLQDYNVSYQRLIAGKYKDIGVPYRKLTSEEEKLLQMRLDKIHDKFIASVAENRKLPVEKVKNAATGLFYLGQEAKDLGLVDALGDSDYVTTVIKKDMQLDEIKYVEYKRKRTLLETLQSLSHAFGFSVGQGLTAPTTQSLSIRAQ